MATFTVWEHDRFGEDRAARAVFVHDGFSWLAFLFPPLWLLAHRMIVVLIVLGLAVAAIAGAADAALGEDNAALVIVPLLVWFGLEANGLRRWSLARRGYELTAVVEAARRIEAEARYFAEREEGAVGPAPAAAPPSVLGLFPEPER